MSKMDRRDFLLYSVIAGAELLLNGCGAREDKTPKQTPTTQPTKEPQNPYLLDEFGRELTEKDISQLRRLHKVTWTWEPGLWVSFPSGNYSHHQDLVPDMVYERGYRGPKTYKGSGWNLDKLQDILLVDFRDYRKNITQRTLNAGLMLPCAVALHQLSDDIGYLDSLKNGFPKIKLIESVEKEFTAENPRNCFRSSYQQLEAYRNTTGEEYNEEEHHRHSGYIARPGMSSHGTGNAVDVPVYLGKSRKFIRLAKKHGFRQRLPEDDPRHFEYYGKDFVDFPRPSDVKKYAEIYTRLNEAKI